MNKKIKGIISTIVVALLIVILQKSGIIVEGERVITGPISQTESLKQQQEEVGESYSLKRAVDGDTLVVLDSEKQEKKVRLIGVNTPETVDPRRPVECFGKEASNFTKELVSKSNKNVRLEFDDTQQKYDKYGRLLAYAYLAQDDGTELFLNKELIKQGYAYEYTYKLPYKFQSEFKKLEQEARDEKRGLWGNACN